MGWVPVWTDEDEAIVQYYVYPIHTIPSPFISEFVEIEKKIKMWERFGNAPNYEHIDNRTFEFIESYDFWVSYWETHHNTEGMS